MRCTYYKVECNKEADEREKNLEQKTQDHSRRETKAPRGQ